MQVVMLLANTYVLDTRPIKEAATLTRAGHNVTGALLG